MQNEINRDRRSTDSNISKYRLANISHHFLSDENERLPVWKNTYIIPVLLSSKNDDYIVYELDNTFNKQKRTSMVLNIEENIFSNKSFSSIVTSNRTELANYDHHEEQALPELCLIPVTSTSTTLALQSDRLILAVHSSLHGVRSAYNQLAFLASLETNFNVCVIMLGAKTTRDAKRFFNFLCNSSDSFLALKLECGGFLLQDADGIVPTEDNDEDIATTLTGVAKGILRDFSRDAKSLSNKQASLAAPSGPSIYLT